MKPRICLVCDIPNWSFDIIAQELKKRLYHKYNIEIKYFNMKEEDEKFYEFLEENDDFDLIHFLWRKILILMESETFKNKVKLSGKDIDMYIQEKKKKISFGVHDFLFLDEENIKLYENIYNKYAKAYYVISKSLYDSYKYIDSYMEPLSIAHDICDFSIFVPENLERFNNYNRELVIGWVGNGNFRFGEKDLKGLNSIIKPVISNLKEEGYNIKEYYADRNEKWRTVEEMPAYYNQLDLCLCMSIHEGTPRPVLEAMSCGVPIISTNVGVVQEVFGKKQKEFILGSRENGDNDEKIKIKLKQTIIQIYNNRSILKEISDENQKSIVEFDGGKVLKEFEYFFEKCLTIK